MLALLHLIASEYSVSKEAAQNIVLRLLENTNNPVEFMRGIEADL